MFQPLCTNFLELSSCSYLSQSLSDIFRKHLVFSFPTWHLPLHHTPKLGSSVGKILHLQSCRLNKAKLIKLTSELEAENFTPLLIDTVVCYLFCSYATQEDLVNIYDSLDALQSTLKQQTSKMNEALQILCKLSPKKKMGPPLPRPE